MLRYHNITTDDMLNGEGLRTVLWLSGCNHRCKGCQNPLTWDPNDGLEFDNDAAIELVNKLKPDYISGLTLSGGDPFYPDNIDPLLDFIKKMDVLTPLRNDQNIWAYTGYRWEELTLKDNQFSYKAMKLLKYIDVLVDGPFIESLMDVKYHWAGSTNQRVIDVQKSLKEGEVILYGTNQN